MKNYADFGAESSRADSGKAFRKCSTGRITVFSLRELP